MQNIVDVACQSPPVVTNATKPAVQTAQATDQESFDLVLIKASERIESSDVDSANQGRESKVEGVASGQDSNANQKTDVVKKGKEVNQAVKTKKSEKSNSSEDEIETETDQQTSETSDLPVGYICPTIVPVMVVEEAVAPEMVNAEAVIDVQALPADEFAKMTMRAEQIITSADSSKTSAQQVQPTEMPLPESSAEETVLNQTVAAGEFTKNLKDTQLDTNAKAVEADVDLKQVEGKTGEAKVQTAANAKVADVQTESVAVANANVKNSVTESVKVETSSVEVDTDTAPPDTPLRAESLVNQVAVQTSQINEPARLAEAPKNEVVTQLTNQIDQMVKTNQSSLRVQLYPEELGHIDLKIVSTKGGIGVTMLADNASTQDVLKSQMNTLKQNIEQAGIQLSNLHIGQGQNFNQQQTFEERENFVKSYQVSNMTGTGSSENEKKVSLQSSMVDYRV